MRLQLALSLMLCLSVYAAEKPVQSKTINITGKKKTVEDLFDVTIRLKYPSGAPANARVTILNGKNEAINSIPGLDWFLINGHTTIKLKSGAYSVAVHGGPRQTPAVSIISVGKNAKNPHDITIYPYLPVTEAGWIMIDPFVVISNAASEAFSYKDVSQLQHDARANNLQAVAALGCMNFQDKAGIPYSEISDGSKILTERLKKTVKSECLITYAWTASRFGLGRFYALEPRPEIYAPSRVARNAFFPSFAGIRDRGGLVVACNPTGAGENAGVAGEFIFDTVAGPLYDAIDISAGEEDIKVWHTLLNLGYRIPALAGGPTHTDLEEGDTVRLGAYLKIPRKNFSSKKLISTIKAGKVVVSNGPFLRLFVETTGNDNRPPAKSANEWITGYSREIGGVTFPSKKGRAIWADAYACSDPEDNVKKLELLYNGEVVESSSFKANNKKTMQVTWQGVKLRKTGWLQLRYTSTSKKFNALSNPLYIINPGTRPPQPVISKVKIHIADAISKKPLVAKVAVYNFGTKILEQVVARNEDLQVPATAELEVSATGYKTQRVSVYLSSEAKLYIEKLRAKNELKNALSDKNSYLKMREILQNLNVRVNLRHKN